MNRASFIVAVAMLAIASLTFAPAAHAKCTRCCFQYPNLTLTPDTAAEARPVMVITVLQNCLPYPRVISAKVNVTPRTACASFAEAFSMSAYVPAFQSRTVSYTFAAPRCRGTYQVIESSSNASKYATKSPHHFLS
jgi:hypothetical protein